MKRILALSTAIVGAPFIAACVPEADVDVKVGAKELTADRY
ncbi:MAG TPA: hypothetical protein PLI43_06780 [Albidovulum sp.]|nr:hypothetical protein [Albidovulum sp.]